jgi:hypothetical protein
MPLTNGLVVMTPTSVAKTGTGSTATINSDGSVVFDLCTTLSLNGVFTSSYDNYMIVMRATTSLAWPYFNSRLRASGTDNTTASSYTNQYLTANGTTVSAGSGSDNRWFGAALDDNESGFTAYIFGPNLAQPTAYREVPATGELGAVFWEFAGTHNQSTAYDGITYYPDSPNTVKGLVTVFGFNQ